MGQLKKALPVVSFVTVLSAGGYATYQYTLYKRRVKEALDHMKEVTNENLEKAKKVRPVKMVFDKVAERSQRNEKQKSSTKIDHHKRSKAVFDKMTGRPQRNEKQVSSTKADHNKRS